MNNNQMVIPFTFTETNTSQIDGLSKIYDKYFNAFYENGFFVEVGAYDGHRWSNTTPLVECNWGGIMIEPIDRYYKSCVDRYKSNDKIEVSNCCIGWENQTQKKVYFGGPCTTIMKDMIPIYNETDPTDNHDVNNYELRDMFTLNNFLEDEKVKKNFDVLCIDVEGAEWKILEVFNINDWRPKMVIVETHEKHPNKLKRDSGHSLQINNYFWYHEYKQIYVDEINSVYIDRRVWS